MTKRIIYQKINPKESPFKQKCIWCGSNRQKNKAHIFSKKIIKNNIDSNVLKKTVCSECNSLISKNLEDFIFKKTPIGYLADLYTQRHLTSLKWIPNYFWSTNLNTWIVCIHDKNLKQEILPNQLMINSDGAIIIFALHNGRTNIDELGEDLFLKIKKDIEKENFTVRIIEKYPDNFFARGFYLNDKLIFTGKNFDEVENLRLNVLKSRTNSKFLIDNDNALNISKYQISFQWDIKTYFDFCSKMAFEFYTLLVGAKKSMHGGFDSLRKSVINPRSSVIHDLIYQEENKTFSNKPFEEQWFSYVDVEKDTFIFPMTNDEITFGHYIYLYELPNGLVCATVRLFNMPTAQLVIGRQKASNKFHSWIVDHKIKDSTLSFFQLLNDVNELEPIKQGVLNVLPDTEFIAQPRMIWDDKSQNDTRIGY